jgi:aspartyl-tRNA(Asn)/glutamyl-tRNA(Gln) amidotransferase subunit A
MLLQELVSLLQQDCVYAKQYLSSCLDKIAADIQHKTWNAAVFVATDRVWSRFSVLESLSIEQRQILPLFAVPFIVKANIQVTGFPVTCASKFLENYIGQFDATVVTQLEAQGAICVGVANMDEFAMGSTNLNSMYGPCKHPTNPNVVPGGSSGGSSVVVATDMVPFSLGSDTGGSVRLPAAWCGIVGFKPTYGAVSRFGLVAYGSSLDQISPFTKSVSDLSLLYPFMAQYDPKDAQSIAIDTPKPMRLTPIEFSNIKIGYIFSPDKFTHDPIVMQQLQESVLALQEAGFTVEKTDFSCELETLMTYYLLACSEAASNLSRFDGIRYGTSHNNTDLQELYKENRGQGFSAPVLQRILLGNYTLSSDNFDILYKKASQYRIFLKHSMHNLFKQYEAILMPVSPLLPLLVPNTNATTNASNTNFLDEIFSDFYTVIANLTTVPALSMPLKKADKNWQHGVGVQLLMDYKQDHTLLQLGSYIEARNILYSLN